MEEQNMLEMRELRGDDLFTVLSIVGKLDIKDELVNIFNKDTNIVQLSDHKDKKPTKAEKEIQEKAIEKHGMVLMAGILQKVMVNLNKIKPEVNAFLAELCGVPVTKIQVLGLVEYMGLIKQFTQKTELKDFLSSITQLLQ